MGGQKEQVVGYRYSFGQHLLAATNKLAILNVRYQNKETWQGVRPGGETIFLNRPGLFGGEEREGGIVGRVDLLDGTATQDRNGYLQQHLPRGALIPAFRYLTSLVFRRVYIGTNWYPKPPAVLLMDNQTHKAWLPELGLMRRDIGIRKAHIMIALQTDPSIVADGRFTQIQAAVAEYIRLLKGSVNSLRVEAAHGVIAQAYRCSDSDYENIAQAVEAYTPTGGNIYSTGTISSAFKAFAGYNPDGGGSIIYPKLQKDTLVPGIPGGAPGNDKVIIMIGQAFPAGSPGNDDFNDLAANGVNMQWYAVRAPNNPFPATHVIDNTIRRADATTNDELFNAQTTDPAEITDEMRSQLIRWADMNPAHIIYDVITGNQTHGNDNTNLIGDSFATVAQTLYDEGFGLSFFFRNDSPASEFIDLIEKHIDGRVDFDPATGKYEITLIRADYDPETLFVFNRENVTKWGDDISREIEHELVNRLVFVYRSKVDGEKKALTVQDLSSIAINGGSVVSDKVEYEGIYDDDLAVKVANRDFRARNRPKWVGTFTAAYAPAGLRRGSAFIVNNPDLGMDNVVCRANSISRPTPKDRSVTIEFIEDQFFVDDVVDTVVSAYPEDDTSAQPAGVRVVEEAPYYLLARKLGDAELEQRLDTDSDIGYLQTAWVQPSKFHIEATTFTDDGSGWIDRGPSYPVPTKECVNALTRDPWDNEITISTIDGLEQLRPGSVAVVGGTEYVTILSADTSGASPVLTVGRGCIDTVPKDHVAGTDIVFCGDSLSGADIEYTDGQTLLVRLRTNTGGDQLELSDAEEDTVVFDQRANRPYPPGNLRLNGDYTLTDLPSAPLTLNWAHRDRTLQTSDVPQDYTSGNIGPEPGTTYNVEVSVIDDAGTVLESVETATGITDTSYTVVADVAAAPRPETATQYAFRVTTVRGGVESREPAEVRVSAFVAPQNVTFTRTA